MIAVRELADSELKAVMRIKAECWTEELAGRGENTIDEQAEYKYFSEWKSSAGECGDIRLLIGAFEGDMLLGAAFASLAEPEDVMKNGIELNGLWVERGHRDRGVSLLLLKFIFDFFIPKGMTKMVVYNHHFAPSNSYYRRFGAQVNRQEHQMGGKLLIDVFICDIDEMREHIARSLAHYA